MEKGLNEAQIRVMDFFRSSHQPIDTQGIHFRAAIVTNIFIGLLENFSRAEKEVLSFS